MSSKCCLRKLRDISPNICEKQRSRERSAESIKREQSVIEDLACWLFPFLLDNMSSFHQVPVMENKIRLVCKGKIDLLKALGRVVRKPVNANPGLKVNRSIHFSCIEIFSISCVLCDLRLFELKTKGRAI